jgi:copper(I)-binding protein
MQAVSRPPLSLLAAAAVVLVGFAGLVRGALPQTVSRATGSVAQSAPIVISGAYVREPANGINAAAYFTIYNTTGVADSLVSVASGAGSQTSLHTEDAGGDMQMNTGGLTIPAHGSYSLVPGKGHMMIEKLYGPVRAGQSVNLELTFAQAGEVLVTAPVIGITALAPSAAVSK